jgi:hypothetical protein
MSRRGRPPEQGEILGRHIRRVEHELQVAVAVAERGEHQLAHVAFEDDAARDVTTSSVRVSASKSGVPLAPRSRSGASTPRTRQA